MKRTFPVFSRPNRCLRRRAKAREILAPLHPDVRPPACYIDTLLVTALRAAESGDAYTAESVLLCIMRHGVVVGERSKHFATVAPSRLARRGVTV